MIDELPPEADPLAVWTINVDFHKQGPMAGKACVTVTWWGLEGEGGWSKMSEPMKVQTSKKRHYNR